MRISDWSSDVCSSDLFRIITGAHFGGEGETGRHWQADRGHLRQIRALTAEEVPVPGLALRDAAAEAEDIADSEIRLHEIHAPHRSSRNRKKIGRASCRERVCQSV